MSARIVAVVGGLAVVGLLAVLFFMWRSSNPGGPSDCPDPSQAVSTENPGDEATEIQSGKPMPKGGLKSGDGDCD